MQTAAPETSILSTWALARAVAVELAGAERIQALCRNLFRKTLRVYLGALGPERDVVLPYVLVEPAEESRPKGSATHSISLVVAIDAGEDGNTAVPRPLDGCPGVFVAGRGEDLQSLVDEIRDHFDEASVGSVLRDFDAVFSDYENYPTISATITLQYADITAFQP